jgi:hypothetical protein
MYSALAAAAMGSGCATSSLVGMARRTHGQHPNLQLLAAWLQERLSHKPFPTAGPRGKRRAQQVLHSSRDALHARAMHGTEEHDMHLSFA